MSYFNDIQIRTSDSPSTDAFGKFRVSEPVSIFDSKQLYDTASIIWSTGIIGNATASYLQSAAATTLIASSSNSSVVRQTKRYMNYQPAKSQTVVFTTNFGGSSPDVIKRSGYFSPSDGLFFMLSGSSFGTVVRNSSGGSIVDTFVSQSNWNLDTMDGTGTSGKVLNITCSQIYWIDFEWLGTGRVRYGIVQGGLITYVHELSNINSLPQSSPVYMASPNQPIRHEIINSGSIPSSLTQICSAVMSEGGISNSGVVRTYDSIGTGISLGNTVYSAVLAIQLKSSNISCTVIPAAISVLGNGGNNLGYWSLLLNPTTNSPFSFSDIRDSSLQSATGSAAATIINEGTKIASGYFIANVGTSLQFDNLTTIGSSLDGTRDVLVLAIENISGGTQLVFGSLTWRESV